jgi:tRNA pseudouridine38-40 synthase
LSLLWAHHSACDSRKYEYLLPSYCLLPPASGDALSKAMDESSPGWRETLGPAAEYADGGLQATMIGDDGEVKEDPKARGEFERRRAWRVDEMTLTRFRNLVAQYKGTQ